MGSQRAVVKFNEPRAKRRLGQHFLKDKGVIDRIVRWIHPSERDVILEIGAGRGALSARLASRAYRLIAVELDKDCIPILTQTLAPYESACVVAGDILQINLRELLFPLCQPRLRLRIAGNLPYNIATSIIELLLQLDLPISDMFFMLQLEVAQRILAKPGSREYGYLPVLCQHRAEVRMGFKISPSCFVPRPKVVSATISFNLKPSPLTTECEAAFETLTKAAFSHRRKTLANSLARRPELAKIAHILLERAGIDGSRRPESLSVAEYEQLAQVFYESFLSLSGRSEART